MSKKRIFADGMETISLSEGMIRMELYSIIPTPPGQDDPPEHDADTELIMSPAGFLRAFSAMEQLLQQLADAGVIKKNTQTESEAPALRVVSPNFQ